MQLHDFTDILDWQQDVFQFDLNSIGTTVINPALTEPRFLNRAGDDYRIFDQVARQRSSSPTLDAADPITMIIGTMMLVIVAVTSSFIPAWRASRVDPMSVLRSE